MHFILFLYLNNTYYACFVFIHFVKWWFLALLMGRMEKEEMDADAESGNGRGKWKILPTRSKFTGVLL